MKARPTYTSDQIARYFERIKWDPEAQKRKLQANSNSNDKDDGAPGSLSYLTALMAHQIAAVPFENLTLHYSTHHLLSLDPEALFVKIVDEGKGGYCMECNAFFGVVLRSLGYSLISAGGRVSPATTGNWEKGYEGWSHMINLVSLNSQRYLVDVALGGPNPTRPLPLIHGFECAGLPPQQRLKLEYRSIAPHSDPDQRLWVYSLRDDDKAQWNEVYAFAELEFFPQDFDVMNLSTMTLRRSFFLQTVVCVRFIFEKEAEGLVAAAAAGEKKVRGGDNGELVGQMILHDGAVRRKLRGQTELVESLKNESQRVAALEKWFGIRLAGHERRGIVGLPTELKEKKSEEKEGEEKEEQEK